MLGFHPVHRVAQSYLGSLWIALDKREGDPGKTVLLRRVQLPSDTPSEARQHIAQAGRDAMQLQHPNVLTVLDVLEQGDELGLVHEHVEGEPLRSLQSWANLRGTSFPVSVSIRIISDLLSAVIALHEAAGTTNVSPHGGLSPDSVLVTRAGETKLCDPLVASCASLLDGIGFNTAKLAYAAPEQVHAVAPLTPASDVFTCGALLWELLAARRLLSGSRAALERKLMEHNLPSLASNLRSDQQVSPALVELVGRALSGDAAKRPASAAAFQAELARCGHELASLDEVAQFVGKLSGQRFDRRSAAVRSRSVPELEAASLEWPVEVPSGSAGPASRRAPRPAAAPAPSRGGPARPQAQDATRAADRGSAGQRRAEPAASEAAQSEPVQSSQATPVSSQTEQNQVPSAPLQSSQAATERSDELPASSAVSTPSQWLPPKGAAPGGRARKGPPGPPPAAPPTPSTARANDAGPATPGAGSSTRKDLPAFLDPARELEQQSVEPAPESFAIDDDFPTETGLGLDDDGDSTVREATSEGWLEPRAEAGGAPATAPGVGLPEPLPRGMPPQSAADVGGRTFVGMGRPAHPALAASSPFARMTPEPFPAPPVRVPSPFDPPTGAAAAATLAGVPPPPRPFAPASSAAGATLLGMPPAAMPPLGMPPAALPASGPSGAAPARPPSPFAPPQAARAPSPFDPPAARPPSPFDPPAGAPPSPFDPPSEPPASSSPSSSPYSRTATSVAPPGSSGPGRGTLPPGITSLRGYEPKFAEAPGELLPRISPSARVSRPRSGWERALGLGSGSDGRMRKVLAGAGACVALAAAVLLVLLLRRSNADSDAQLRVEPSAAVQREAEPGPSEPGATTAAKGSEPTTADSTGAGDAGAAAPEGEPAAKTAAVGDAPVGLNAPQLSDAQLSQLFALEQYEDVPSCPERAAAGKAKAKKNAAKEAKEATRLLKVARTELKRKKANPEKAHGYLCRATSHDPSNWQAQQALAEVSLQLGNPAQAQAAAEKALARKPEDVTLLGLLGDALALTGDLPGSRRAWLRSARGQGPEPERMRALAGTYRKLAERVARSSSYPLACALYRRALVLTEGSYAPSIGLAEALRALRQPRAALAWAERAAHAFPKDARVQLTYGDILYDNGQKQEAKAAWKAARKAQPNNALAARRLARGKP